MKNDLNGKQRRTNTPAFGLIDLDGYNCPN